MENYSYFKNKGLWLSVIAIAAAVLGYFTFQMPLGFLAIVLGVYGVTTSKNTLNWIAIVLGTIVLVLGII